MVETNPLYQRRGLATALLEVARDTIGEGHTVNHSSSITNVAQAWSDAVDSDRPELRSYVPEHDFKKAPESDIDNMEEWEPKEGLTSGIGESDFLDSVVDGDYLDLDAAPDSPVLNNFEKEDLLDDQHDSLWRYTQSWYKPLNKRLRGISDSSIDLESTLDKMTEDLDAIIDTYGDVSRDSVVFRGMSENYDKDDTSKIHQYLENAQVGDVFSDSGYVSTSNDSSVALKFGSAAQASFRDASYHFGSGSNSSFWAITIPSGGKALALPRVGYGYGSEERSHST
jgi:hypothetical protein